jgi:branched-chain amino acid transport system permease protein
MTPELRTRKNDPDGLPALRTHTPVPFPSSQAGADHAARLSHHLAPRVRLSRQLVPWAAVAALLVLMPFVFSGALGISVLTQVCIAVTFALAYNVLLGATGLLSFGHALYFGVGAYITAHLLSRFPGQIAVVLVPLIGGLGALGIGAIFAVFTVRKGKITFAMISLAIGQLAYAMATIMDGWSGGDSGIRLDPSSAAQWGIDFGSPLAIYFLIAAWTWLAALGMFLLRKTPLGKLMNATRDNPERLEFVGFSPTLIRGLALSVSAGFAGIAGALYALAFQVVTLDTLSLQQTTTVMLQTYIGGYTSFGGPVIGALLMTLVSAHLSSLTDAWPVYLGTVFLLIIVFSRHGIAGAIREARPRYRAARRTLGAGRIAGIVAVGVLLVCVSCAGYIAVVEMAQSLSDRSGAPLSLGWLGRALVLDPHAAKVWVVSVLLLIAGVSGLLLLRVRCKRWIPSL